MQHDVHHACLLAALTGRPLLVQDSERAVDWALANLYQNGAESCIPGIEVDQGLKRLALQYS